MKTTRKNAGMNQREMAKLLHLQIPHIPTMKTVTVNHPQKSFKNAAGIPDLWFFFMFAIPF